MADVQIDEKLFSERLSHFYAGWKADKRSGDQIFGGVGSILVIMGKAAETQSYSKSSAVHFWLLGYEFPATIFLFTAGAMYVVTTAKKAKHLEPLKKGKIPLEILLTGKDPEQKAKTFEKCVEIIKGAGKKVGIVANDQAVGPFVDEWKLASETLIKDVEQVDISPALSQTAFSLKDETELRAMRNASRACSGLMSEYFVEEMSELLDDEKKITHNAMAQKIDEKIDDAKFFKTLKNIPSGFDASQLDWAYRPCVQSGGKYNIKSHVEPDQNNLHPGVIIADFGLRYKSYSSIVSRTYLVDPSKAQESNYKLLHAVHESILKDIREGVVAKDLYNRALGMVKAKKPDLEQHFLKNLGSAIGLELKDTNFVLNGKNARPLKDGMTLCITTGFNEIANSNAKDKKDAVYSLVITDTVRVTRTDAAVFTKDATNDPDMISFYFKEAEEPTPKRDNKKESRGAVAARNITKTKLRSDRPVKIDETAEARRREHQRELAQKRQKAGLERYTESTGDKNGVDKKKFKRFESYKRDGQLPSRIKDLAIFVDVKSSTIILPIMGRPVPFHINAIKNASKSDEGEYAYLRINFLSPGQGVGRKDDQPFEDASAHFVRSLTFRSKDTDRMADIAQQITDVRKDTVRREQEKKEMEDVVEQDKLVEMRNRRPARLPDVFVRPALDGKRVPGEVEIHQNGLRYNNPMRAEKIDILFSNVKHLFFQPCQGELIVLIHVHLMNPIIIGKRKTKDVQFYREATEMQFDETGNRKRKHRYGDEEEFEAEQEERRRRAALDREFKAFAEKISEAVTREDNRMDVDIPFRELGFNGVPHRSSVLVSPTTECLVQLTEPPFMVVTLEDIEIAHLERVQFGLKNFDMVLVLKDFTKAPLHINTIPVESLEGLKDWLDSVNLPFTEGPLNLNWGAIMKTVTADTHQFFIDGGWSFLAADSDSEGASEEEEESAFEMSDEELVASEESSEDESDFDDDASAEASDDASAVSDESGEDWDELEKKAKKKDRENGLDEDEDRGKKRKR